MRISELGQVGFGVFLKIFIVDKVISVISRKGKMNKISIDRISSFVFFVIFGPITKGILKSLAIMAVALIFNRYDKFLIYQSY